MRRRLGNLRRIEVPRGPILWLAVLVLALPAGLSAAHQPRHDSSGNWIHHHTTHYRICNDIDQDSQLRTKAREARDDWRKWSTQTGVVPVPSVCHPGNPPGPANIELMDAYFGQTGWRVSTWEQEIVTGHLTHTHVRFNLSQFGSLVTQYHKRTLACREIGRTMGIAIAPGNEGQANDCMSFNGNIQAERSRLDYPNNYTYTNQPGPHSRDLLRDAYAAHEGPSPEPQGPVIYAREYTGNPAAGGQLLAREWLSPSTGFSRVEADETITTRSTVLCSSSHAASARCVQERQLMALDASEDMYSVYTGMNEADARIGGHPSIVELADPSLSPSGQGPLSAVMEAWQVPPPGHGDAYNRYDLEEELDPLTERVWLDAATAMPVATALVDQGGSALERTYYTYDTVEASTLPSDHFAVRRTEQTTYDEVVNLLGADPVGPQVDTETGESFEPYYLGDEFTLAGDTYCLEGTIVAEVEEPVDDLAPGAPQPGVEEQAALEAREMSVDASYNRLEPGEACLPGVGSTRDPDLEVISDAGGAPPAELEEEVYRETAQSIDADPTAGPDAGGVRTVTMAGEATVAYVIVQPDDAPGRSADGTALILGDSTQVTITGELEAAEIVQLAAMLEPL